MYGAALKNNVFANLKFGKLRHVENGTDLEKTRPGNDEDQSNKILKSWV